MSDCGKASRGNYVQGCRCDACREANRTYFHIKQRKDLLIEVGQDVSYFVEAEPVRRKVRQLMSQGYTMKEICRVSGVTRSSMRSLMNEHPRTGKPVRKCKRETKDAICAIKGRRAIRPKELVDGSVAAGHVKEWSEWLAPLEIAEALGVSRGTIYRLLNGHDRIIGRTAYQFALNIGKAQALVREKKREAGWVV